MFIDFNIQLISQKNKSEKRVYKKKKRKRTKEKIQLEENKTPNAVQFIQSKHD